MHVKRVTLVGIVFAAAIGLPAIVSAQTTTDAPPPAPAPRPAPAVDAHVKGHVLPIVAGARAAQLASAALRELAATEPFQRQDARRTAELAEQAVRIARERADELTQIGELAAPTRNDARAVEAKLKVARSAVEAMQRQVGVVEGPFRRHEVEQLRTRLPELDAALADALFAIERVAQAHAISTTLTVDAPRAGVGK